MVNLQIESLAGSWLTLKCAQIDGTSAKNDGNHLVYPSGFCSSKSFLIKLRLAELQRSKILEPQTTRNDGQPCFAHLLCRDSEPFGFHMAMFGRGYPVG
jgi:hypothetical protein